MMHDQPLRALVTHAVMVSFALATIMPSMPARAAEPIRLAQADDTTDQGNTDPVEQNLDLIFAALDELDRSLDRGAFDVAVKAGQLAFDPRRMFAFVRDQVTFEPYVGALRGADGTLQARAGNALDQSLLLAALLQEAGYRTRIAAGSLSDLGIERVLAEFSNTEPGRLEEPWTEAQWQSYLARLGATGEHVPMALAQHETALDEASIGFWERVDFHQALLDRVMPVADRTNAPDLQAEARRHYWVRYLDQSGAWIDLDPTVPGLVFGASEAEFETEHDQVPEALWHRLTLTSTVFVADADDAIEEHVVLEHSLRIADLVGRGIVFRNLPDREAAPSAENLLSWIEGITEFTATLTVGGTMIPGKTFDLDGNVYDAPAGVADRVRKSVEDALGGAMGVLDMIGSDPPAPSDSDGRRLVGQRITYSLLLPTLAGSEPSVTTTSRDIVSPHRVEQWDPAGPRLAVAKHERSSMIAGLLTRVEIAPVVGRLSLAFLAASEIDSMRANRGLLASIIEAARSGSVPAQLGEGAKRGDTPFAALGLAIETQGLLATLLANRFPNVILYRPEAALIAYETGYRLAGGEVMGRRGYDIIHSRMRAVARSDGGAVAEVARLAGVVETLLESELLRPLADVPLPNPLGAPEIFEAAVEQNIELALLAPGMADAVLVALAIPESVKADIAGDLARGYAVIVPARSADVEGKAAIAWWRVDPGAGATLGMMPGGGGSAMTEDLIGRILNSLFSMDSALFFGDILIGMIVGLACIVDSDAANSESPISAQIADLFACVAVGVVVSVGIYSPASHARRMAIAGAMLVAFIASTNRIWMRG